jgi:sugar lactone lactonase YvrE
MNRSLKSVILIAVISALLLLAPSAAKTQTPPQLQVVQELTSGPGNITITPDGRTIISLHQFFNPEIRVAEVRKGRQIVPFPNPNWSAGGQKDSVALDTVLGIQSDTNGVVWMLDNAQRGNSTPKLVGWDTKSDRPARIIYLPPPITPKNAFVNDLAVDVTHQTIYIADPAGGDNAAIIVVDLNTGLARRVLQGHKSVTPEDLDLVINGKPVQRMLPDGKTIKPRVGVNPIALDANNEWLYYGPMHGTSLYRVRTADLRTLSEQELAARVERYSEKPICDGISIDKAGNIYLGELAANAIGAITPQRRYQRLVQSDRLLSWVDAFSFGSDGKLYAVSNQLHRSAVLNAGQNEASPPFYVLSLEAFAPGIVGR